MKHLSTGIIIAVKRIRATLNTQEQKRLLMDLDVAMRSVDCDYTVWSNFHFYFHLRFRLSFLYLRFKQGTVWIN